MFHKAEARIDKVVAFFERLHAELDSGIAECHAKRGELFDQIADLNAQAAALRNDATKAGEAVGKAMKLKNGLTQLLS